MPGLVGIIAKDAAFKARPVVDAMVKTMMHEKSYVSGIEANAGLLATVAWVAHKGSFAASMPVWNESKTACLIFAGENFPCNGDSSAPANRGEYLLRLYETQGTRCFKHFNGIFSGVILDCREKKAVLFNDRFGLGRIYWRETADGLYFASEAKALLKAQGEGRALDPRGLGEFFSCGCVLQNRTLFSGISLLPAASAWTVRPGAPAQKETYFSPEQWAARPELPASEYYSRLRDAFARILPRYFSGSSRVALSLTGGLDSRMIMAWAPCTPYKLHTFTFDGMYRECADARVARQVAKTAQQYHESIKLNRKFFAEFPALAKRCVYFTDGTMDVSGAVDLFMNKMAAQIAPVRLTGNYGDEILRGNVAFRPGGISEAAFNADFAQRYREAAQAYAQERAGSPLSFIAFKQMPWHHYSRLALEQSQLVVRSPYLDNELVDLAFQAPRDMAVNRALAFQLIDEGNPQFRRIQTDRGRIAQMTFIPGKVRRFAQEFMPRAEYMYDYGMPQWMAPMDRALSRLHLERLFLGRQKFYHFRLWYRNELAGYVKEVLLDERSLARSYLDAAQVKRIVQEHVEGTGNHTLEIHRLLTAESLQRQLIERL